MHSQGLNGLIKKKAERQIKRRYMLEPKGTCSQWIQPLHNGHTLELRRNTSMRLLWDRSSGFNIYIRLKTWNESPAPASISRTCRSCSKDYPKRQKKSINPTTLFSNHTTLLMDKHFTRKWDKTYKEQLTFLRLGIRNFQVEVCVPSELLLSNDRLFKVGQRDRKSIECNCVIF